MKSTQIFILLIAVGVFCFSCKTTQLVDSNYPYQNSNVEKNIPAIYRSFHYRGSATVNFDGQIHNCQFNLVNVVDSVLYIQLNVAGIEIGRALATPTNVLFINKFQKEFFSGNYSVFTDLLNMEVDYFMLQSIFSGAPTRLPDGIELFYQRDDLSYDYPFFSSLTGEYYGSSLRIDVKKVTFNVIPEVSAAIPKNYTPIKIKD